MPTQLHSMSSRGMLPRYTLHSCPDIPTTKSLNALKSPKNGHYGDISQKGYGSRITFFSLSVA